MESLDVLLFAASMRADSFNRRLARIAEGLLSDSGARTHLVGFQDFDVPAYNGDVESSSGIPSGASLLKSKLDACDAFVVASPEYNGSVPGTLKNLIDWTSRFRPQPFAGHQALLMSASPSKYGGNRGLWALRVPLEVLGVRVFPGMFSLANASEAFDENGIADSSLGERLESLIRDFLSLVRAVKNSSDAS
jgi:NAD(P)H-dependent FMN reductase